jgi:hypothetical protein
MSQVDPDNLPAFQIPQDLLDQLYEFTGSSSEGSKGFLLAYSDQNGNPMIFCRAGSQIVEMGIRKALEKYLIEIENVDAPFDINGDQE